MPVGLAHILLALGQHDMFDRAGENGRCDLARREAIILVHHFAARFEGAFKHDERRADSGQKMRCH